MTKPHVHAALIKAWADGAEIQFKDSDGVWLNVPDNDPTWSENVQYRVKPQKRKCWVCLFDEGGGIYAVTTNEECVLRAWEKERDFVRVLQEIEYDI